MAKRNGTRPHVVKAVTTGGAGSVNHKKEAPSKKEAEVSKLTGKVGRLVTYKTGTPRVRKKT